MTKDEINNLIKKSTGLNIQNFNKIDGGESFVYIITLANNTKVVLKLPIKKDLDYSFETLAYNVLEKNSVLAPSNIKVGDDFLLTTVIQGSEVEDNPELFLNEIIIREAAMNLRMCHQIKMPGFGRNAECNSWTDFLDLDNLLLSTKGLIDEKSYSLIKNYLNDNSILINNNSAVLVHGDFCLQHIFSFNGKFSGFIDFGDSFIGDPLIDLAYFKFKEINKEYIDELYGLFSRYYFMPSEYTETTKIKLNIYMIYWGLKRITQNRGNILENKFKTKIKVVLDNL